MTRSGRAIAIVSAIVFAVVGGGALLGILAARVQYEFFWLLNFFLAGMSVLLLLGALCWFIMESAFRQRSHWSATMLAGALGLWLALAGAWEIFTAQNAGNQRRGDLIVDAVIRYRVATGNFPATLEDLTPVYLPRLPRCWYGVWAEDFWYRSDTARPYLKFNDMPDISGRFNYFDGSAWRSETL